MDEIPKDPFEGFADDSVEPNIVLSDLQRQALVNLVGDSKLSVGLADIGAGYVKTLFYNAEGEVVDKEMLHAHYGDAVMPEFRHRD